MRVISRMPFLSLRAEAAVVIMAGVGQDVERALVIPGLAVAEGPVV